MSWHDALSGHALPGGPVGPIDDAAQALAGVVALRNALEEARAAGLIRDSRLTRFGLRHPNFGNRAARFEANLRLKRPSDVTPDQALDDFHEHIYDFSPLPGIDDVWPLADEVISQLRWRIGFDPVDLEQGDEADEDDGIGYEIERSTAAPPDLPRMVDGRRLLCPTCKAPADYSLPGEASRPLARRLVRVYAGKRQHDRRTLRGEG